MAAGVVELKPPMLATVELYASAAMLTMEVAEFLAAVEAGEEKRATLQDALWELEDSWDEFERRAVALMR